LSEGEDLYAAKPEMKACRELPLWQIYVAQLTFANAMTCTQRQGHCHYSNEINVYAFQLMMS
jgi:hypothetical protein